MLDSFHPLEPRRLLSAPPPAAPPAATPAATPPAANPTPPAQISTPSATPPETPAPADRRTLLSHLTPGPLTASLSKTLRHSGPAAFDASLLQYMTRRAGPFFFFNGKQLPGRAAYANQFNVSEVARVTGHANALLQHVFPEQINSETYTIQLPSTIDWDAQPATTDNADFLHGLNRHAYWKELATAYGLTGDGRYVREIAAQLESWSAQTPALADPNDWALSSPHWWLLDAADRATNWTYAYFMALGSPDWTPAANTLFLSRLWDHGDFLDRATPSTYRSNKTAIQAQGLQRLGLMFPEFADAARWEQDGTDMTFRCLAAQFYPDGGHVEQTPAYAMSALDSFLGNFYLAQVNGRTYWTKNRRVLLNNAADALLQLLMPNHALPGLSDTYRNTSPRRVLETAGRALGGSGIPSSLEGVLMFGVTAPPGGGGAVFTARGPAFAMPDAGYFVLRNEMNAQLVFDAGPKGGEHGHFDLLNFEWGNQGYEYVVDPGPYRYDNSQKRREVISTPAHNTISIDGLNHAAVEGGGNPMIILDDFTTGANEVRVTAHHHAYESLPGRPTVGRTIWLDDTPDTRSMMIVIDWGRSDRNASHTFSSTFNLPQTTSVGSAAVLDYAITGSTRMRVQTLTRPGQTTTTIDAFVSNAPPPNEETPSQRHVISETGTSYLSVTLFSEYQPGGFHPTAPASIAFDGPPRKGQPVHVRLTMPDGAVRLLDFPPPDLGPLPTASPATAPIPFSTLPIPTQTNTKFYLEPDDDSVYNHTAEVL